MADEWTEQPTPSDEFAHLVAVGDALVAYRGSHEGGYGPDQVFDPATGVWSDLPRDPLAPSFDRAAVSVDGRLYLFAKDLVANPGADGPSLVRGAVLDGDQWTELPPSEAIGYGAVATDGVILSPEGGFGRRRRGRELGPLLSETVALRHDDRALGGQPRGSDCRLWPLQPRGTDRWIGKGGVRRRSLRCRHQGMVAARRTR